MNTPLTLDMLLETFARYNTAFSPWNWAIYFLGIAAFLLAFWPMPLRNRLVSAGLGILWLWVGIAFFMVSFAPVYPPAYLFGVLFVVQGLAFLYATWRESLVFGFRTDIYGWFGLLMGVLAIGGYPAAGYLMGEQFPQIAIVGAPCPAVILTFGLLLMTQARVPWPLLVIPALWAVSAIMPIRVGMWPDVVLLVGGLAATAMIIYRDRQRAFTEPKIRPAH